MTNIQSKSLIPFRKCIDKSAIRVSTCIACLVNCKGPLIHYIDDGYS